MTETAIRRALEERLDEFAPDDVSCRDMFRDLHSYY